MADPNTQIDWWIAQAWQEVQGGADHDSLVVWLHENELTALSSYTILQAALSCSPEEAKEIVFAHPVWAGEDPGTDLGNVGYTSETLEPEPEPDPTFELDDWADEIEDDQPVYGEEGYQVDPSAGAAPIAAADPQAALPGDDMPPEAQPAFTDQAGFDEAADTDPTLAEPAEVFEPDSPPAIDEDEPAPMDAVPSPAEPFLEPEQPFELAEPLEPTQPAAEGMPREPAFETEPVFQPEPAPEPAMDRPATPAVAPPPILKTLPSTPAERAAVFAGAFGKKPAAAQQTPAAPDVPPSSPRDGAPPTNDLGLASVAETTPAQSPPEHPQPAMATAQMPPPLVHEQPPEIELPQPAMAAEPVFTATQQAPEPAPPLSPAADSDGPGDVDETSAEETDETTALVQDRVEPPALDIAESQNGPEPEPAVDDPDAIFEAGPAISGDETEIRLEPTFDLNTGDLQPGIQAEVEPEDIEPPQWVEALDNGDEGELHDGEWEQEPASLESSNEGGAPPDPTGIDPELDAAEEAPRPSKRVLLDPEDKAGDNPEDMAAAAKMLGINFRESDPTAAGTDPEMARTAKELGISFREDGGADLADEETQLAAQKLGISFREGDSSSSKQPKPLTVKYLPILLGIVIIMFLLLIGRTFVGDIVSGLWS